MKTLRWQFPSRWRSQQRWRQRLQRLWRQRLQQLWRRRWRCSLIAAGCALAFGVAFLAIKTEQSLLPLPATLDVSDSAPAKRRYLDRNGVPLNTSYTGDWNTHDRAPLHEIPPFLRQAFIHAEDKRFYSHKGPDWAARLSAAATNFRYLDSIRGASTISEQVVRMLHPRPRTIWTRWIEGFEAAQLERRFGKDEILEFYLNQVPYASQRRGVRQAAEFYFARDLNTLSDREMLALAVLVRSPSRLDLHRDPKASHAAIARLADAMVRRGALSETRHAAISAHPVALDSAGLQVFAPHFLDFAASEAAGLPTDTVVTTLDVTLQARVQHLLDSRMRALMPLEVHHGAVIVVDNASGEVLAWVVAGGGAEDGPESHIDPITTPRQPGSALKPLLYALALEQGHTLADEILDAPLAEGVGDGLHRYRNYSDRHYGSVTLRDALANSLNIPAVKLLHAIGADRFLDHLERLGVYSLREHPEVYGDGLALGNGEVTLFELVQAYHALANRGQMSAISVLRDDGRGVSASERVVSPETAALIGNALSDPNARAAEFGQDSVLNLPVQTAIKTGTSSDYRDAWSVGFDSRFTVGIWMGNLDQTPTRGVTGSIGPALLLRSIFAWLNRDGDSRPLYLSPQLTRRTVCVSSPMVAPDDCIERDEWFDPAHATIANATQSAAPAEGPAREFAPLKLRQPTPGLELAFDPRLPPESQAFRFLIDGAKAADRVEWLIDGEASVADGADYLWAVTRGMHSVEARVNRDGILIAEVARVEFRVR